MCWYIDFISQPIHPEQAPQLVESNTAPTVGWVFHVRGVGHAPVTLLASIIGPLPGPLETYNKTSAEYTIRPGWRSPVVSNRTKARPEYAPSCTNRPVAEE
ncbi:MAG: hypothetical protein ACRDHK_00330 [Actinomycetota bacterium]